MKRKRKRGGGGGEGPLGSLEGHMADLCERDRPWRLYGCAHVGRRQRQCPRQTFALLERADACWMMTTTMIHIMVLLWQFVNVQTDIFALEPDTLQIVIRDLGRDLYVKGFDMITKES